MKTFIHYFAVGASIGLTTAPPVSAQRQVISATLEYHAPVAGLPKPNFSPKGTQIALTPVAASAALPPGSTRPAKTGTIKVGPDAKSWIPILVTADAEHPTDLTRLFVDQNRNGNFTDDGPAMTAAPAQNAKT